MILSIGLGLGALLAGSGVLYACIRLGQLLARTTQTIDEVERAVTAIGTPIISTLTHVDQITGHAEHTLQRVDNAVEVLEHVAGDVAKRAGAAQALVAPFVGGVGTHVSGWAERLRRLLLGDHVGSHRP